MLLTPYPLGGGRVAEGCDLRGESPYPPRENAPCPQGLLGQAKVMFIGSWAMAWRGACASPYLAPCEYTGGRKARTPANVGGAPRGGRVLTCRPRCVHRGLIEARRPWPPIAAWPLICDVAPDLRRGPRFARRVS